MAADVRARPRDGVPQTWHGKRRRPERIDVNSTIFPNVDVDKL